MKKIIVFIIVITVLAVALFFRPIIYINDSVKELNIIRIQDETWTELFIPEELTRRMEEALYEDLNNKHIKRTLSSDIRYPSDYVITFEFFRSANHNVATIYVRNNSCYIKSSANYFIFKMIRPESLINKVETIMKSQ